MYEVQLGGNVLSPCLQSGGSGLCSRTLCLGSEVGVCWLDLWGLWECVLQTEWASISSSSLLESSHSSTSLIFVWNNMEYNPCGGNECLVSLWGIQSTLSTFVFKYYRITYRRILTSLQVIKHEQEDLTKFSVQRKACIHQRGHPG